MHETDVLVLEEDAAVGARLRKALARGAVETVLHRSLAEALGRVNWGRVAAVVADVGALAGGPPTLTKLREAIETLRRAERAEGRRPVAVIVTSGEESLAEHEAALGAGADLYLSRAAAAQGEILRLHLERLLGEMTLDVIRAEPESESHVADIFALPTERLRAESGRLDAARIADALSVPLKALAEALEAQYTTVHKTPDSVALQPKLVPFANVLAMLDEIYEGDERRTRAWLQTERRELGGNTPLAALLRPGGAAGVEQFVAGAWLGEPD